MPKKKIGYMESPLLRRGTPHIFFYISSDISIFLDLFHKLEGAFYLFHRLGGVVLIAFGPKV